MYSLPLVRRMVLHFADLAGWEGDRYLVTLSRRTFDRAAKRHGAAEIDYAHDLGATLINRDGSPDRFPVTWIDPAVQSFHALSRTCAHEALHAARPKMRHGREYEKAVTRMLRGQDP